MQSMRPTAGSCLFDTRGRHTAIGAGNAPAPTRCEQQSALDCSGSLSQRARRIKPADRTNLLWPRARQGTPGDADRWARRVMGQPRTGAPDRRRPWRGRCARQVRASSANLSSVPELRGESASGAVYFCAFRTLSTLRAASSITAATSLGWDRYTEWLAPLTSVVRLLARA